MDKYVLAQGILIPFLGTSLGAACVLFLKRILSNPLSRAMNGFAAGVMVAASIWSLLIPSIDQADYLGRWAFVPAAFGFCLGVACLMILDAVLPCIPANREKAACTGLKRKKTTMVVLAVTLHNIPEGMAVGAVYAGLLAGNDQITAMGAMALSIGIAIQNFPEGAIISMPLRAQGMGRWKSLLYGALSGIVEPIGAVLTIWAAGTVVPILPYLLSFAAGAMMYVVIEELLPEMAGEQKINIGTILFTVGFVLMMVLDVALG